MSRSPLHLIFLSTLSTGVALMSGCALIDKITGAEETSESDDPVIVAPADSYESNGDQYGPGSPGNGDSCNSSEDCNGLDEICVTGIVLGVNWSIGGSGTCVTAKPLETCITDDDCGPVEICPADVGLCLIACDTDSSSEPVCPVPEAISEDAVCIDLDGEGTYVCAPSEAF